MCITYDKYEFNKTCRRSGNTTTLLRGSAPYTQRSTNFLTSVTVIRTNIVILMTQFQWSNSSDGALYFKNGAQYTNGMNYTHILLLCLRLICLLLALCRSLVCLLELRIGTLLYIIILQSSKAFRFWTSMWIMYHNQHNSSNCPRLTWLQHDRLN